MVLTVMRNINFAEMLIFLNKNIYTSLQSFLAETTLVAHMTYMTAKCGWEAMPHKIYSPDRSILWYNQEIHFLPVFTQTEDQKFINESHGPLPMGDKASKIRKSIKDYRLGYMEILSLMYV
jgi:hypothetical protein